MTSPSSFWLTRIVKLGTGELEVADDEHFPIAIVLTCASFRDNELGRFRTYVVGEHPLNGLQIVIHPNVSGSRIHDETVTKVLHWEKPKPERRKRFCNFCDQELKDETP